LFYFVYLAVMYLALMQFGTNAVNACIRIIGR
jgi:hypothetical protein